MTSRCIPIPRAIFSNVVLIAMLAGCSQEVIEAPPSEPTKPIEVSVTVLKAQAWRGSVRSFGTVEALEEVGVAAELSGTVIAVHVNEGDRVTIGQLLLALDPEKRELALTQSRRQVEQSKAALEEARLKLNRRRNLAEKDTISEEVLDNAQLAVDASSARYHQSLAALQLAERELADTRIVSPTDGVVDIRAVEPGEPVQAGVSLITLQSVASLRVQTWVSEGDVSYLRPGSTAQVFPSGMPNLHFQARIEWVGVNADRYTGNFPVKLILEEGEDILRPGMTASVAMQTEEIPGVLILPERALVDYHRRRVVFIEEDGVAKVREPVLAAGLSNSLLVLAGLAPGDRVITEGQHRLVEGVKIRAVPAE
ncbi:MAG: efflux RND transporter periplasmic adaptor subunit [Halioglobus sp.]